MPHAEAKLVYLNGSFILAERATVSVFDRGFLMGDGIYEGVRTTGGRLIALRHHVDRFRAGLNECRIPCGPGTPFDPEQLGPLTMQLVEVNRDSIPDGEAFIYWQVTRGSPAPGHPCRTRLPHGPVTPCVFAFAVRVPAVETYRQPEARTAALRPDTRWTRGHVKSISLLGSVLAAIEAGEHGHDDAIMHLNGRVTEGAATNVFLASKGTLITPSLDSAPMLAGATRAIILEEDPNIIQRPVTAEELLTAEEVMLAGTNTMVVAVTSIDGRKVGTGAPGPMAQRLLDTLRRAIARGR